MVVKTVHQAMSRKAVVFSSLGLALTAAYAAACSSGSSGNHAGGGASSSTGATSNNPGGGISSTTGGANSTGGVGNNASGNNPGGGDTMVGTSGANTGTPCVPMGQSLPTLPASFTGKCGICHSAYGDSANPAVPNLFNTKDDITQFTAQVRMGKDLMPPFDATAISDADIQQAFAYFKAGVPGTVESCVGKGNDLCGNGVDYTPLFVADAADTRAPIVTKDANGHLIYRGAGRVRFRHEMEPEYSTYHGHYFEGRTFGYIIDDAVAAGGSTLTVTFLPNTNQYYSAQGVNQEGGADLNLRFWKLYGHPDGNAFAGNVGGASKDVLPMDCADPKTSWQHAEVPVRSSRTTRAKPRHYLLDDQFQVEFGIFMARYSIDGTKGPPVDGGHVRNNMPLPNGCTEDGAPFNNACYSQANYYSDSFRYVVGRGTLTPFNQDCTMSVPATGSEVSGSGDCGPTGAIGQAVAAGTLKDRMGPTEAGYWWFDDAAVHAPALRHVLLADVAEHLGRKLRELRERPSGHFFPNRLRRLGLHSEVDNIVTAAEQAPYVGIAGPLYNQGQLARAATSRTTAASRRRPACRSRQSCSSWPARAKTRRPAARCRIRTTACSCKTKPPLVARPKVQARSRTPQSTASSVMARHTRCANRP